MTQTTDPAGGGEAESRSPPAGVQRPRYRQLPELLRRIRRPGRKAKMLAYVALAFHVSGLLLAVNAVMSTRTSQGAVAWVVSLVSFPYVAVPAYLVLGRSKFNGYVTARRQDERAIQVDRQSAEAALEPFLTPLSSEYPGILAAERLAELPTLAGNAAELLVDGEATFASILKGIARARDYVLVQFYIVEDDEIGRALKEAMMDRAKAGVRVYFMYDEVGSNKLPGQYKEDLRQAGAEVYNFHSRRGPSNRFQINFRNHRKIVVVDGAQGWTGGHNVGDEYLGRSEKFSAWRDTHVRIEGPAVLALQLSFFEDWHWATDANLELNWTPQPSVSGDIPVLIVPSGPADERETAGLMFTQAINSARNRLWLASPYFVPDPGLMNALRLAALRGVDVKILIPDDPDHYPVYLANFHFYEEMKDSGVEIYRYTAGFMHSKTMVIDSVSAIGTANFDNRSFRLNFEITAFFIDPDFTAEVVDMFEKDFKRSRQMTPADLADKPFWFRPAVRAARLTAPLL